MVCAKSEKIEMLRMGVAGKAPFGPLKPRRVPCPPATVKSATFDSLMSWVPNFCAFLYFDLFWVVGVGG